MVFLRYGNPDLSLSLICLKLKFTKSAEVTQVNKIMNNYCISQYIVTEETGWHCEDISLAGLRKSEEKATL